MTDELPLLLAQLDTAKEFAAARLDGLTDDEYLWEPVAGMWSLRPRGHATSPNPIGGGEWLLDNAEPSPEPDPAPLTTIAWRLAHLTDGFAGRFEYTFGGREAELMTLVDFAPDARGGVAALWHWLDRWRDGVASLTVKQAATVGYGQYPWGLDPQLPIADIVWWVNRETIHHLAEVALLRDLYRASFRAPRRLPPA